MNLEVGKIYKTTLGNKIFIYSKNDFSFCGISIKYKNHNGGIKISYYESGCPFPDSHIEHSIESEWVEPEKKPRFLAYHSNGGTVFLAPKDTLIGISQGYSRAPWLDEPES